MADKLPQTKYLSQLDKEIEETLAEIIALLNCFIDRTFPLFGEQWEFYKQLTVKLYRLRLTKQIKSSDAEKANSFHYSIEGGYKV